MWKKSVLEFRKYDVNLTLFTNIKKSLAIFTPIFLLGSVCIFTTCCIIKFNMIHTFYKEPTNLPGTVLDTIKYAQHIITN